MDSTDDTEVFIAELLVFISVFWTSNSHKLNMLKEFFCNVIILKLLLMSHQWKSSPYEQRWKFLGIYLLLNVVKELRQNELKKHNRQQKNYFWLAGKPRIRMRSLCSCKIWTSVISGRVDGEKKKTNQWKHWKLTLSSFKINSSKVLVSTQTELVPTLVETYLSGNLLKLVGQILSGMSV